MRKNGYHWVILFGCLLYGGLYSFSALATQNYFLIQDAYVAKKDLAVPKLHTEYIIRNSNIPSGATIPKNKQLSVVYEKPKILKLAKKAKKFSPVNIAMTAALASSGWVIDELTGQVSTPTVTTTPDDYNPSTIWAEYGYFQYRHSSPSQLCENLVNLYAPSAQSTGVNYRSDGKVYCSVYYPAPVDGYNNSYRRIVEHSCSQDYAAPYCTDPTVTTGGEPVSQAEQEDTLVPWVFDLPDYQIENDVLKDHNGQPYVTDELIDQINEWGQSLADADPALEWDSTNRKWTYTDPSTNEITDVETGLVTNENTDPTSSNTSSGTVSGTTTTQANGDQSISLELPAFCSWASIVCDWYEWTTAEPEMPELPDLPIQDLTAEDFEQDYNTGLGAGSCPSSSTSSFMGTDITFEWTVFCDAATNYFKPLAILFSTIAAAYIISGRRPMNTAED
jgi:hypothetical protein